MSRAPKVRCALRPRYVLTRLTRYSCGVKIRYRRAMVGGDLDAGLCVARPLGRGQDPIPTYYTVYRVPIPRRKDRLHRAASTLSPLSDAPRPQGFCKRTPLLPSLPPPPSIPFFLEPGRSPLKASALVVGRHVPPSPSPFPILFPSFFPCFGYSHGWAPPLSTAYITSALPRHLSSSSSSLITPLLFLVFSSWFHPTPDTLFRTSPERILSL